MRVPAVVFEGVDQVTVRDIEMPPPGPGEVQVRTRFSTVSCGTEGWVLQNRFTWAPTTYPCVAGYQRTGDIVALGEGVQGWRVGERVMATTGCWKGSVVPFWGCHVAVGNTQAHEIYRIPAGAEETTVSATVVAEVGYNAAFRPALQPDDWVVVYGDGIIGQFGAQAARARGARVVLVGHRAARLDAARRAGIQHAVAGGDDVVARIRAIMGRDHAAIVIDTVQSVASQKEYLPLLEYAKGQIVYSGFTPGEAWASMAALQQRELTTHFIAGWTRARMEATLDLIAAGKLDLRPLTTHRVPFTRGAEMWRMIREKTEPSLGVVFEWLS